ncbi:DUF4190 domain-containing protein [Streptomyces sp. NBC_00536]|uniref:DUF4190 domain-containing protein n=1 Tax=Streptomyces sp. NBC_00536 TaxID=2975769 RepID=UPI002E801CCE|nr:DUF4190 domain-containing protein [Streptomyces sp. NBC_00536]WUC79888.1 DUF4190 domain-containing protein [Streptomyces sp. NBC_00536]
MNTQGTGTLPGHTTAGTEAVGPEAAGSYAAGSKAAGRNGRAEAALVLGVTGLLTSVVFIGGPLGVAGLVLGAVGLARARRTGVGLGMSLAGLVMSLLAIVVSVLAAVLLAWYADHTQECYQPDSFRQYTQCVRQQLSGN